MIRFVPEYKPALWGGRQLEVEFGRSLPEGRIGEAWELVDVDDKQSQVTEGPHAGASLRELWHAGHLGGSGNGPFPFTLRWIDTSERLSVQVHPDAATCERMEQGKPGTKAWFVAHTGPQSMLLLGHYPGLDSATLKQAGAGGTIHKWLYETQPRIGELILVPGGTLHGVGSGFLLLEVQESDASTYRVYDWDHLDETGKPRPLHLEEAAATVDFDRYGAMRARRDEVVGPCFRMVALPTGATVTPGPLRVFVAEGGPATLEANDEDCVLEYGDVVVAEPGDGTVSVKNGSCVYLTEPSKS